MQQFYQHFTFNACQLTFKTNLKSYNPKGDAIPQILSPFHPININNNLSE